MSMKQPIIDAKNKLVMEVSNMPLSSDNQMRIEELAHDLAKTVDIQGELSKVYADLRGTETVVQEAADLMETLQKKAPLNDIAACLPGTIIPIRQTIRNIKELCDKPESPSERLEYLRGELRAERISADELVELQSLVDHIDPSDTELLEAAGVPEFPEEDT